MPLLDRVTDSASSKVPCRAAGPVKGRSLQLCKTGHITACESKLWAELLPWGGRDSALPVGASPGEGRDL